MNRPSLISRIKKFTKSLFRHIRNGLKKVSKKEKARRLSICNECPFKNPNNECSICGCYLTLKTDWKSESCPEGKW